MIAALITLSSIIHKHTVNSKLFSHCNVLLLMVKTKNQLQKRNNIKAIQS